MKLVDILARELKVWPEGSVTAVQDSDGEVKFDDSPEFPVLSKSRYVWIRQGNTGDTIRLQEVSSDNTVSIVTRAQWQAAVDALKAEKVVEWNGEGLPPVGTVCEYRADGDDWRECVVIAHHASLAVCWIHCNKIFATNGTAVRPIRAPEKIAAEERNIAINAMVERCPYPGSDCTRIDCSALYDAGYRKFEIVDN